MSSLWTDKYAILRDLSLAQGCEVPADLEATLAAGDKPPALNIVEETEEEFFKKCNISQDVEGTFAPDFDLIQHMLKMIQPDSSDSEDNNSTVQTCKPDSVVKKNTENNVDSAIKAPDKSNKMAKIEKKVRKRRENVAVNSILQGFLGVKPVADTKTETKIEAMKLLKPIDFMSVNNGIVNSVTKLKSPESSQLNETKKEIDSNDKTNNCQSKLSPMDESIVKVNGWLYSNKSNSSEHKNNLLEWQPNSMFKKKSVTTKSLESDSVKSSPEQKSEKKPTTMYQPSTLANEYYERYIERSKVNTIVREDVWSRAERIMKELDEKKKLENEVAPVIQQQMDTLTSYDEIQLPQHRHLLTGDCIICEIFKKNGVDIDLESLQNTDYDLKWLVKENSSRNKS
ncbi:unnamed protein product [Diatraea saccharalis]|uniref:Uncharacterized protein n=1 Tax=Diatraea saccharalis TaxID=40085 RepID=A0A9N9WAX2_9NEOP|nr:unnamed protein product [Diatraea saccharalis]